MNGSYIYDLLDPPVKDNSTESYDYQKFFATQSSDLNNFSAIRFVINAKDQLYHFHQAYFEIKGKLVKEDNSAFNANSGIAFIHNAFPYMFRNFIYKINGTVVDNIDYPGQVSSMLHNVLFSSNKAYESGLQYFWYPDRGLTADSKANKGWEIRRKMLMVEASDIGSFKMKIPFHLIFSFAEYTKVLTQVNHEFEMTRQADYFSLFKGEDLAAATGGSSNAACPKGKIKIESLLLWVPVVKADGIAKINMKETQLNGKNEYVIAFRQRRGLMSAVTTGVRDWSWNVSNISFEHRPQWLLMGFQKDTDNSQTTNHALFANMGVTNMFCVVNNQQFPYTTPDADFPNLDFGNFYMNLQNFRANYLQIDPLINESGISPMEFKNLCTIYAFDLTKHVQDIRGDIVNTRIEVKFSAETPAHVKAFACLISEKEIFLKSDGTNMVIH